ncbi:acyl-CoA dehydrogenase family protein [Rhodococcus fascians]|uniref:acyl-CoA dehydrogenase family protein n=1 Tax=Rhodococcoides fascians TaxID=1828 RepID=UPI00050C84C7|nr:acyl-CoA dehydrogenase family protein [Rhodococcus fascians]MDP9635907.1 alkylation response protein AidB-like acyl-CoA dehydrogenase [Rhodococcus cercidiphylli]AMY52346.1 (R)-benzylsuccinyl-CoA dehydrogenase [Rhodococcus fascians D188]MBY4013044.1 acyl-CoA dehydrogenase family protein [Rhodococcus fascians]MBY4020825.1 acyl-CoA dehydrogenase family protein [Rhodococcus fascians]MBY4207014.1 acyl-CoA dehydrogenase family protein [Rhodococcus fascians]
MTIDVQAFAEKSEAWLAENLEPRTNTAISDPNYAIFHNRSHDEERELIEAAAQWQGRRVDAGFGAITWGPEWGGPGLTASHERAYVGLERQYDAPERHETILVTVELVAPTIHAMGSPEQKKTFVEPFLRADELCCQLFSEPGAGSDLAGLSTKAVKSGGGWRVNGQKVWSSGAQFSQWGLLIARTDTTVPKHRGMTAFMMPMDAPGVDIRPIRQMSGGSTFNEVFLADVELPDSSRLGDEGDGWTVALTTLGFERSSSAGIVSAGGNGVDLVRLAKSLGISDDPLVRQQLAEVAVYERASALMVARYAEREMAGAVPGVEGSIGKLVWTQNLKRIGDAAATFLGPRILADTGAPDTFAWTEHLLGAPGYRIAGGSDEIQRNIIGERGLGLPREPR